MYYLIASSALFVAGLLFFIISRIRTLGIGYQEFISTQYIFAKVPFGTAKKKLLLRRLSMQDILAIGNIPNWLMEMLSEKDTKKAEEKSEEAKKLSEEEYIKQTIEYYTYLQAIAEKTIVKWDLYVKKWQEVDPSYLGRLPDVTLQYIFNLQLNPTKKVIKKKTSYYVLRLLQTFGLKNRQATLKDAVKSTAS